jgi:hypothetical protein
MTERHLLASVSLPCSQSLCFLWLLSMAGCAAGSATTEPNASAANAEPTQGAEPVCTLEDVQGTWAEYWAPAGRVETERYAFLADGRFGWLAPKQGRAADELAQRSGQYVVDGHDLVLRIDRERPMQGTSAAVSPVRAERVSLGPCPPNQEARALDASYTCLSIGGRAFFRERVKSVPGSMPDTSAFFQ